MCRLFGLLGAEPMAATNWLVEGDRSLLGQSNTSADQTQGDGWGIAWYGTGRTPQIEKGTAGAHEPSEVGRFREVAKRARGPVIVAHLRKASNPMHLPRARLIGPENSQPFSSGSDLFAHNGMIPWPGETRSRLGRFEGRVHGVNDSEVLFWLFARHVEEIGDPIESYVRTVRDLLKVWNGPGHSTGEPYSGLNLLYTRGPNELWGFCHSRGEHGSGLRDPARPYYSMAYRADSKHVVVGSEPLDEGPDWQSLKNGTYVHARSEHGLVGLKVGAIPSLTAAAPEA